MQRLLDTLELANDQCHATTMAKDELQNLLEIVNTHFLNLYQRLQMFSPLQSFARDEWQVLETRFGIIRLSKHGEVLVDPDVWSNMNTEFEKCKTREGNYRHKLT